MRLRRRHQAGPEGLQWLGNVSAIGSTGAAGVVGMDEAAAEAWFGEQQGPGNFCATYAYGQCTWWTCMRAKKIGWKGIGQYWGDGKDWARSAASAGYRTTTSLPVAGSIISWPPGVQGSDPVHGHVGIVESVDTSHGTITTSEKGAGYKVYSKTYPIVNGGTYVLPNDAISGTASGGSSGNLIEVKETKKANGRYEVNVAAEDRPSQCSASDSPFDYAPPVDAGDTSSGTIPDARPTPTASTPLPKTRRNTRARISRTMAGTIWSSSPWKTCGHVNRAGSGTPRTHPRARTAYPNRFPPRRCRPQAPTGMTTRIRRSTGVSATSLSDMAVQAPHGTIRSRPAGTKGKETTNERLCSLASSVTLKPDYSWVPSGLQSFVAGILGMLITASVIVLIMGVVKFMFSKLTATLVDNPNGIKILLGVILAACSWGQSRDSSHGAATCSVQEASPSASDINRKPSGSMS